MRLPRRLAILACALVFPAGVTLAGLAPGDGGPAAPAEVRIRVAEAVPLPVEPQPQHRVRIRAVPPASSADDGRPDRDD